jgi:plasmid replication initiation protein
MNSNLVDRSFYLTSIFADMKSDHSWTTNEEKMTLLVFEKLSEFRMFFKKHEDFEILRLEIQKNIKHVPLKYTLSKEDFRIITGVKPEHLAREIKKTAKGLLSKYVMTPHPLRPGDDKAFKGFTWFTDIEYLNNSNDIIIKINESAIDRLVAFVHYTEINFKNLINVKNHNAIKMYIAIKIILDSSKKQTKELEMSVQDLKYRIGLQNKYINYTEFKKFVIEVIKKEINAFTDINLDYEFIKVGRSFSKIKFIFDYKPEYLEQKSKAKAKQLKEPTIIENTATDDYDSPFEQILIGWNIRAKKVGEIEERYSLDAIQSAIDKTLEKERAGEIKITKAAIFLGILENKQLASEEQFERAKKELEHQKDKNIREKISAEYDMLSSFILSNQDIIQSALTANTKYLPITDKDAIPVFIKLKNIDADKFRAYTVPILSFYHFESNSNVPSILSDIVDRSYYIEIDEYNDDMSIVQAYKKALDKIKEDEYITSDQKDILRKEVHETINVLLGL